MRRRLSTALAAVLLAAGLPALAQAAPGRQSDRQPNPHFDQVLSWAPCTDLDGLECATYTAPMDWRTPADGRAITIAISRLRPASGQAKGVVLTNPGGPGGPGRALPLAFAHRAKLVDNMEVIGIDVRGTGASDNLTCGGFNFLSLTDPRDRSRANTRLIYDSAELQATACQARSGEFGKVVNTEQTVRDLDLLRHLLGREKVSWIGYSGGTWMGAYYATYFPDRVDKFVLDSNTDFTSTFQDVFDNFGYGFERRFRVDFLPWVARYDELYHLGTTAEQVRQVYETTRAKLATDPLLLPDGTPIDAVALDLTLVQVQYSKTAFPDGAQFLAAVAQATAAGARTVADVGLARYPLVDSILGTRYAITCNDTKFRHNRTTLALEAERLGRQYPLMGYYQLLAPCAFWDRPALELKRPTGRGVPPVLMVQSVRDPATPLEGAQRAQRRFEGARLLTVTDEGDHGIYAFGNACVDDVVEAFIVDGAVPPAQSTCPGVPLPDPTAPTAAAQRPTSFVWPL
ncbi:alpha/beta hydrolase [Saccharothrix syringae]|uniref:Alpha/beta hydrolase n=1 Tax=Saccharothrix syringae TaxID=103733 RepID=A0A5Q0HAG4_SACSY|nr:alpha/beta hydrolase [Saccharothrix syringae]QFZ22933.1 alpha/beta hydrolase [Saccharothrix syringae]